MSVVETPTNTVTPSKTFQNQLPITPKTRKRKSYIANEIRKNITAATTNLSLEDKIEVGFIGIHNVSEKTNKKWKKVNSMETMKAVWNFWHSSEHVSEPTLTSRLTKLQVENKPHIQVGLSFCDTVDIIMQRNQQFYLGQCKILNFTLKELYVKYITSHPESVV